MQPQLQAFVKYLVATDKYNTTLTIAAIKAVYSFMQRSGATDFKTFIAAFPRLKYNFKDLMAAHYKTDIFTAVNVKTKLLQPELLPFD